MSALLEGHPRVVLVKVTEYGSPLPKLEIPAIWLAFLDQFSGKAGGGEQERRIPSLRFGRAPRNGRVVQAHSAF
jgi:hypothetical protein